MEGLRKKVDEKIKAKEQEKKQENSKNKEKADKKQKKEKEKMTDGNKQNMTPRRASKSIMATLIITFLVIVMVLPALLIITIITWLINLVCGWLSIAFTINLGSAVSFLGLEISIFTIIALMAFIVSAIIALLYAYYRLAPQDKWFTFLDEARAKIVVKGGEFVESLWRFKNHYMDEDGNILNKNEHIGEKEYDELDEEGNLTGNKIKKKQILISDTEQVVKEEKTLFGGFVYYGFYPFKAILGYVLKWRGVDVNQKIQPLREELVDYVLLKEDQYYAELVKNKDGDTAVEDKNKIPIEVKLLFTLRVINPYKAVFKIQNWLEASINRALTVVRQVVAAQPYDYWITDRKKLQDLIMQEVQEEILMVYGIQVVKIEIRAINPTQEYLKYTTAVAEAEREKEKEIIQAEKERRKTVILAKGEKKRIEIEYGAIEKFGDLGKLIRVAEAAEGSNLAAALQVNAVPGLQSAFNGIFGKPADQVSSEEIRELTSLLKSIAKSQTKKKAKKIKTVKTKT